MLNKTKMLEAVTMISIMNDTIENLYYTKQLLKETYTPLTINTKNIQASLLKCIHNYKAHNITDIDKIIDILNTEFIKANILFTYIQDYTINVKYPESGIVYSEADDLIYIYVNDTFIKNLNNINVLNTTKELDILTNDIYLCYSHENTHTEQYTKQNKLQKGIETIDIKNVSDFIDYLSHPREIAAHAREIANYLLLQNKNVKEITNLLNQNSKSLLTNKIYEAYYRYFGSYKDNPDNKKKKERLKIWNKFKRQIIDFALLDKNNIMDESIIYKFIYTE